MAEASGDAGKDKRPNSGNSSDSTNKDNIEDMAEWERRLAEGDLPEDFLAVTEPQNDGGRGNGDGNRKLPESPARSPHHHHREVAPTGLLVDIPTVTASNSVPMDRVPPPASLKDSSSEVAKPPRKPLSTEESDRALALELQRQLDLEAAGEAGQGQPGHEAMVAVIPANVHGRLTVTVAEAKLARNYGLSRMDPYCRVRIGHSVYETPTAANGAREPKWNKTFNVYLLKGTKNMDLEIYDECTFTNDSMIAHATFPIPEDVFKFLVVDDWFPLSGQEGHEKEGVIHLILSLQPLRSRPPTSSTAEPQQQQQQPQLPTEEQLNELCKMFPNLDKDIITSVFVEKRAHQEEIVNALLQMSAE